jgi:hypothetical protein
MEQTALLVAGPRSWRIEDDFLVLDWRESDGPEVAPGAIESVGSRPLKRLVA